MDLDWTYYINGGATDRWNSYIYLSTSLFSNTNTDWSTATLLQQNIQIYADGGGSGTRSSILFPTKVIWTNNDTTKKYIYVVLKPFENNDYSRFYLDYWSCSFTEIPP